MQPFSLLIKPTGPDCNIACKYCFYSGKTCVFGEAKHRMSMEVAEKMIGDMLSLELPVSSFAWQGGEPTLMGVDFYKQVVSVQQKLGGSNQQISNALQTNGIALNDEWCKFLNEYNWLVGISLDGPKKFHDHYRLDKAGNGTFDKVLAGIDACKRNKVEFNILVLLNDNNVTAPDELFDFFVENGFRFLQFVPCVETNLETGEVESFSITPEQYGRFICRIFDRWIEYGPQKLSIRLFDSLMNYVLHGHHTNCTFGNKCSDYIVIEHNGDAFCCDFFVDEEHKLGNVLETPMDKLVMSDVKRKFARQKSSLNNRCLICRYNAVCRGGCLKDRVIHSDDITNTSYFCPAYKTIFEHCLERLRQLAFSHAQNSR